MAAVLVVVWLPFLPTQRVVEVGLQVVGLLAIFQETVVVLEPFQDLGAVVPVVMRVAGLMQGQVDQGDLGVLLVILGLATPLGALPCFIRLARTQVVPLVRLCQETVGSVGLLQAPVMEQ